MPIDISLEADSQTAIIRGYDHVEAEDMVAMRAQFSRLVKAKKVTQALVDARDVTLLIGGSTISIFWMGASYATSENPLSMRTAIVLPEEPQARRDLEFLETVEVNRGRQDTKVFTDIESARAWLSEA